MAPLEGVTNRTFRSCFYDHFPGLDGALTPFLPVPDRVKRVTARSIDQVCPIDAGPVPEIPQLLLSESDAFIKACETLERAGFSQVNWNLGCPSRGVVRKRKGAGLLPYTGQIVSVLEQVIPRINLNLSLKLRLGMEQREELFRLIPHLNHFPLKSLILHPRLGNQMYSGAVDLEGFEIAQSLYDRKICYNGDIRTLDDYVYLKKRLPDVEEWMIGRGMLADPLLLNRILSFQSHSYTSAPPPHPFRSREFLNFIDDLIERLRCEFHKELSLLNYIKGVLSFSFSIEGTPQDMREDLKKMSVMSDWMRMRDKIIRYSC